MTTQYGGHRVCAPGMNHCILFRSSPDRGRTWSRAVDMPRQQCRALGPAGAKVGAGFPKVAAGPRPGDLRVAWEDDRNGATAWNVWYRATTNGGASWSQAVRLSDRGSGAPYSASLDPATPPKSRAGFRFPYGDYF